MNREYCEVEINAVDLDHYGIMIGAAGRITRGRHVNQPAVLDLGQRGGWPELEKGCTVEVFRDSASGQWTPLRVVAIRGGSRRINIVDAIRAAEADPTIAMHVAGDDFFLPKWKFPLRYVGGRWENYYGHSEWSEYFGDPNLSFTVEEIMADWETVPVADVEAARTA